MEAALAGYAITLLVIERAIDFFQRLLGLAVGE